MKKHKVRKILMIISMLATMTVSTLAVVPVAAYAAENTEMIVIEKPDGWKTGDTTISVSVDASVLGEEVTVAKIEAKGENDDGWQDITEGKVISISGNQTVYVRVTDSNGNVYEQNRSIKCYDSEKPTLSASLTDGILTIQGNDSVSGIASITVNGTVYSELKDGQLRVQLTQKDFKTKTIEITATDGAGNTSEKYSLQNPYYEWAAKQQEPVGGSNMTTTTETGSETEVKSPLPQEAQPTEPTEAKGTVEDKTVTNVKNDVEATGETVDSITNTATEGTKEFYTISTKSGKIFYLIVDNAKAQDNVYFLTEVSERDLMNFTLSDTVTLPEVDTVYAEVDKEPEISEEPETMEEEQETEQVQMPEDENSMGSYLLIGLAALGVLGGGYYFKIYKPKHEYEEDEEYEEEYEENRENEDDEDSSNEEVLEDEDEE